MTAWWQVALLLAALILAGCNGNGADPNTETIPTTVTVTSSAFEAGGTIPVAYTCDGQDTSPPLAWSGAPDGTESFALIVDDPDAPQRTWVHWVLYNIPASANDLPEGASGSELPPGTAEGLNDWERSGYGGPCPPAGRHRYFHKLYALDTTLSDLDSPTRAELEQAMESHILARGELVGTYGRSR